MNGFIATFADESAATRIMRMIERHCPRLMRTGGGALSRDCALRTRSDGSTQWDDMGRWRRVTPEQRAHIIGLGRAGLMTRRQIREATGATQSSVYKILDAEGITVPDGRVLANQRGRAGK
jgi:hypothetical protein